MPRVYVNELTAAINAEDSMEIITGSIPPTPSLKSGGETHVNFIALSMLGNYIWDKYRNVPCSTGTYTSNIGRKIIEVFPGERRLC